MRASQLLCTVIYLCIIVAVISFHIHSHIGIGNDGVLTISASEYREVRVVVVIIGLLPFGSFQQVEWSHTFQYLYNGRTSDVAGKVSTAIDVVRVEEVRLGAGIISTIEFVFILLIPFDDLCLCSIPNLIPDDIDGEVVLLLSVIAFYLSTHILSQSYVGIAFNVGRSEQRIGQFFSRFILDVTPAAAEHLSGEVGSKDVDIGVAIYLYIVAAAIDVAIDGRCLLAASGEGDVGIADYLSHLFWTFGKAVC